jgi:hypothetical protein
MGLNIFAKHFTFCSTGTLTVPRYGILALWYGTSATVLLDSHSDADSYPHFSNYKLCLPCRKNCSALKEKILFNI